MQVIVFHYIDVETAFHPTFYKHFCMQLRVLLLVLLIVDKLPTLVYYKGAGGKMYSAYNPYNCKSMNRIITTVMCYFVSSKNSTNHIKTTSCQFVMQTLTFVPPTT